MVANTYYPRIRIRMPRGLACFFGFPSRADSSRSGYRYYMGVGLNAFLSVLHEIYGDKIYRGFTDNSSVSVSLGMTSPLFDSAETVRRVLGIHSWRNIASLAVITGYYLEKKAVCTSVGGKHAERSHDGERMRVYSFKAPPTLMEKLFALASRQGISVGEAIRRAIAQYILANEPHLLGIVFNV